jgi:hypothetical protein
VQPNKRVSAIVALLACVPALATATAACASSSSSNRAATHASAAKGTTAQSPGSIVKSYENGFPKLSVPALAKKPPKGIKVAGVVCTVPTCQASAESVPYKKLGWDYIPEPYDITQGPPALDKSLENAIQAHPKYIVLMAVFPQATFQSELTQALKAGIGVVLFASGGNVIPGTLGCMACLPEQVEAGSLEANLASSAGAKAGQVAYASDPTAAVLVDQYNGAKKETSKLLHEQLPLITVSQAASPSANASTVVGYLQRNTNIKYVEFSVESLATGVPQALAQDGLSDVKVIVDAPAPTDLQEIAAGSEYGAVADEDLASVWRSADILARNSIKSKIPSALKDPAGWDRIVDKSNITRVEGKPTEPPNFEAIFEKAWHVG